MGKDEPEVSPLNDGRASPSRRAAPRAWNTSDSARWGQARPTVRFTGSSHGQKAAHTALELKTVRTAAFRLLRRTLRSRAFKRPKGHGPEERFMGSDLGPVTMLLPHER